MWVTTDCVCTPASIEDHRRNTYRGKALKLTAATVARSQGQTGRTACCTATKSLSSNKWVDPEITGPEPEVGGLKSAVDIAAGSGHDLKHPRTDGSRSSYCLTHRSHHGGRYSRVARSGRRRSFSRSPPAAASSNSLAISAINPRGITVPSDQWTVIPWPRVLLNDTPVRLDTDHTTWLFPPGPNEIYTILANIAWDNARSPSGKTIKPPTHRKLIRILQQGTGTPQIDRPAYIDAASDLTYNADLAALGDQMVLSHGSKGYQQQQVTVQAAVPLNATVARIWVEAYQDSGMPLACRWDGTSTPNGDSAAGGRGARAVNHDRQAAPSSVVTRKSSRDRSRMGLWPVHLRHRCT